MNRFVSSFLALAVLTAGAACDGGDSDSDGEELCSHDPPLTYDNWGKGFISQYCVGCHSSTIAPEQRMGAPESVNLDTYEFVLMHASRIEARSTGDAPTMPPSGGPFAWELDNLEEWLQCSVYPDVEQWKKEQ